MIEVGFTGTRQPQTVKQQENLANELKALRLNADLMVNGCCHGSDRVAWNIWRDLDGRFRFRPGDKSQWDWAQTIAREQDELFAPVGYMERNGVIAQSVVVVATPFEDFEVQRSGTWATIRRARAANSNLIIILPNGEITREKRYDTLAS